MIHKVVDHRRVVHHNVVGLRSLVTLCGVRGFYKKDLSPASWRRQVDCMTCLVQATTLPWCGHGAGQVFSVEPRHYLLVRRCHRCMG